MILGIQVPRFLNVNALGTAMLELRHSSGSIGAEVAGIDLCKALDKPLFDELNKALLE